MPTVLKQFLPPTRSGRTFVVASTILGSVAALQLFLLAWCFAHGNSAARREARKADAAALAAGGIAPVEMAPPTPAFSTSPPAASLPNISPAASASVSPVPSQAAAPPAPVAAAREAAPAAEYTRPTPAPPERTRANPPNLLENARSLRQRGDANSALARLREGLANEPNNPDLIAEMGLTYEAMQMPDKAAEQWQRVYDMGEGIGALYYMADTRLHSAPGRTAAATPGPANSGTGRDNEGFQDNAVLKITDLHTEELTDDPSAEKKLVMRIVVKARPGTVIDPSKVKIETYFYDLLDGKDVVLTDAKTDYQWLTPPIDWANDASEVLQTSYYRPRTEPPPSSPVAALAAPGADASASPAATSSPGGSKKRGRRSAKMDAQLAAALAQSTPEPDPAHVRIYLGYSVRVYYDRQLQDVQADPIRLLQRFPPQLTLPPDDENLAQPANAGRR